MAADYASWVKAGADRLIELLAEHDGAVTVFGEVRIGSIIKNKDHRLIECSFVKPVDLIKFTPTNP